MRSILISMAAGALLATGCNNEQAKAPENTKPAAAEIPSDSSVAAKRKGPGDAGSAASVASDASAGRTAAKRITAEMAAAKGQGVQSALEPVAAGSDDKDAAKNIRPEDLPQEGDQVMIAPQLLSKLLPGFNFDKVDRKDPINVRELLESQGIALTNYQQLVEMGITNWSIVRAQKPAPQAAAEQ